MCAVWVVLPKLLSVGNVYENVQELLPRGLFAVFCMGDFMLTELGGHYGMVFAAVLVAAIVFLFSYFLWACLRQKNQLGMLMGLGCALVLLQQTGCYVLLNAGIVNLGGGFFCPFVTYGRGGMLLTSVLLGILLSVYRHQNVLPKDTAVERLGRIRVTFLSE